MVLRIAVADRTGTGVGGVEVRGQIVVRGAQPAPLGIALNTSLLGSSPDPSAFA
jgi:hypothetical protein